MTRNELNDRLPAVVQTLASSIHALPAMHHLNRIDLPNRNKVIQSIGLLRQLVFPGYFDEQTLTESNLPFRIGEIVMELFDILFDQIRCCLRYREQSDNSAGADARCVDCDADAARIVSTFFDRMPAVREILSTDVQAAFEGDPAARNTDETVFCYPGLFAISVQRFAHELYKLDVPLVPRMMTEYAHSLTGIDMHPGAQLGRSFFIDHGTGVVIGETCQIGDNVKVYQGVTLGALAPAYGQALRGQKRHPTIEDNVTIYAGATILGGETVVGQGSVIGGNVFVTSSIPPLNQVSLEPPKLKIRDRRPRSQREMTLDFQI